jgi:hypothetical protein
MYLIIIPSFYSEGATSVATGFIPGQIWYSKDPFVEGDTVKVYTALWNNGTSPLSAKVEFYDKNVILGFRDIVVQASKLQEVYISWKVTSGDHSISAKIISPSITSDGKKEKISVENNITETDKRFIPIVINTIEGTPATTSDVLKNQMEKATSSLSDIVPNSVSKPVSENVGVVDSFRVNTLEKITENKIIAEQKIDELKKAEESVALKDTTKDSKTGKSVTSGSNSSNVGIEDATEKPITYLKLIFLSILSFIFGSQIIFYLIIVLFIFLLVRFIYRKIRNR